MQKIFRKGHFRLNESCVYKAISDLLSKQNREILNLGQEIKGMKFKISQTELHIKTFDEELIKQAKKGVAEKVITVNNEVEGKVMCTSPSGQFSDTKVLTNMSE